MVVMVKPPVKLESPNLARERSNLDRIRESMGITIPQLNNLLKSAIGHKAPSDFGELNCGQTRHVIRYLKRNEAKIWLERKQNEKKNTNEAKKS